MAQRVRDYYDAPCEDGQDWRDRKPKEYRWLVTKPGEREIITGIKHLITTPGVEAKYSQSTIDQCVRKFILGDWGKVGCYTSTTITEEEKERGMFATDSAAKLNKV